MKKYSMVFAGLGLFLFASLLLTGCLEDQCSATRTFVRFDPVFVTQEEIREEIQAEAPRELENPGKIYFYKNYILVNELREGLHVIDNTDPAAPQNIAFIRIPGNVDMAVKGDVLYADNVLDLLAIDITDVQNPQVVGAEEGVFEDARFYPFVEGQGYIVDYIPTEVTETVDCEDPRYQDDFWIEPGGLVFVDMTGAEAFNNQSNNPVTGVGGSMARFTIYQDYLYTVGDASLSVFDITNLSQPNQVNTIGLNWGVETIYPYEDKLFLGSRTGMYLFDNSNPAAPQLMSEYSHWNSCDPVVVEGNTAYVTLRGGNACDGFVDQLEIIDVTDITAPQLIKIYPMDGPYGLAVRNQVVYLCDGDSGLKVYDVEDPEAMDLLDHERGVTTYDVISLSDSHLLMIGADGLYQYDTSDKTNLQVISHIPAGE